MRCSGDLAFRSPRRHLAISFRRPAAMPPAVPGDACTTETWQLRSAVWPSLERVKGFSPMDASLFRFE